MEKIEEVYILDVDGTCLTVYDDNLPLKGKQEITRAGYVEPVPDGSGWTVDIVETVGAVPTTRRLPTIFKSRAEALKAEKDEVNKLLMES